MPPVIPRTGSAAAERLIAELRALIPSLSVETSRPAAPPSPIPDTDLLEAFPAKPLRAPLEVWNGSVCVKIYPTKWHDKKRRKHYRSNTLIWYDAGKRFRQKLSSTELAKKRAEQIAGSISTGQTNRTQVSQARLASMFRGEEFLAAVGSPPIELVCAIYKQAVEILRPGINLSTPMPPMGHIILEAIKNYAAQNPSGSTPKTVDEVFAEMIPARRRDGSAKNTIADWVSRIGLFVRTFKGRQLTALTPNELNDFLRKLPVSRRTRNNYRGNLCDFYRFARECGYVAKNWNPLDEVPRVKNETVRIEIFTPEEVVQLLAARVQMERARKIKTLVPFLAIGIFGGVRHEEMCAPGLPMLDWRQIDFDKKEIQVLPDVARKIGRDRILPMQPNLVAWLKPYAKPNGRVCELDNANNAIQETAAAAGLKWKDNGPRKTFISSRLAITKNIGQVADEAGTSPERIRKNYKKTIPKREADRLFDIWPTNAQILQLPLAL
jgi:integrase